MYYTTQCNSNSKRSKLKFEPDFKTCEWNESEIVHGQNGQNWMKLDNFLFDIFTDFTDSVYD